MLVINVPELPKSPGTMMHKNATYGNKERSRWVWLVRRYSEFKGLPAQKAKIIFTRMAVRNLEGDDLQGSFDLPLRALKSVDIVSKDADLEIEYRYEYAKRDHQGIKIEVIAA